MRHWEYYLGRAEETRVIAENVQSREHREQLLRFAAQYERLAEEAKLIAEQDAVLVKAETDILRTH